MIEILTSLVVVALGVLGVAKLQLVSLAQHQNALMRIHAIALNNDLLDRLRAEVGVYSTVEDSNEFTSWLHRVKATLPDGHAELQRDGSSWVITTRWRNAHGGDRWEIVSMASEL
jgi:type IV pilus assembly protein PilV